MKESLLESIIEEVKNISIVDIIESEGFSLKRSGTSYSGHSPFRLESSPTSFTVCTRRNIFTDWVKKAEGYTGNAIKFYSLFHNVSFVEATFNIALNYGIITEEEFESSFKRRRFSKAYVENLERKHNTVEKIENNKADDDTLDKVFSLFMEERGLNEEHQKHLIEDRMINKETIEEIGFFTFPTRAVMRKFTSKIIDEFGNEDILSTIPGFFKWKGDKMYTFPRYKGIGIPIKDAFGRTTGLQIRNDEGDVRYVWFSSSFAIDDPKEKSELGTSSGAPIGVIIPKKIKHRVVFITEGIFKAEKIAETFGCIALSVQGVGTWKGIEATIKDLEKSDLVKEAFGKIYEVKHIWTAYDADISYNPNVFEQARLMTNELSKKI